MLDMSKWANLDVDVITDLRLDPRNVRLSLHTDPPESDLIRDLFNNEATFAIVESIVQIGWLTHEIPIVVQRDGQLVVVEGNRRVAALKVIQNPYLAPNWRAQVAKITQDLDSLEGLRRIMVKQAPTQDEANQLIAALHTGEQRRRWKPARQAAFFQAQLDSGKSPRELIAQYPTVDVRKFIIRSNILKLFQTCRFSDPALQDFLTAPKFSVSTLERLFTNERFRDILNVTIADQSYDVSVNLDPRSFCSVAEKIVHDMRENSINTRILNKTSEPQYEQYLNDLRSIIDGSRQPNGSITAPPGGHRDISTSLTDSDGRPNGTTADPSPSEPQRRDTSEESSTDSDQLRSSSQRRNRLNFDGLQAPKNFPWPVHAILEELRNLDIQRFPNATMDLLRTFLEKTIKSYAESTGAQVTPESNSGRYVQLGRCLIWLEENVKTTGKSQYIQVIQKMRGTALGSYIPTVDHLNAINHNHQIGTTPSEVAEAWELMAGVIKMMLAPSSGDGRRTGN